MDSTHYLQGAYPQTVVSDLVPGGGQPLEALFIFESPHYDELDSGIPLTGVAGKLAMNYVRAQKGSKEGLGPWLARKIQTGNVRVAIANVSQVPLQEDAFGSQRTGPLKPALAASDWNSLDLVRTVSPLAWTPAEARLGQILTQGLQDRLEDLDFEAHATIVPCGKFAQHFLNTLRLPSGISTMPVPHPARSNWQKAKGADAKNLVMAREFLLRNA